MVEKSLFLAEKIKFAQKKFILLSILIPIYNCSAIKLVADLHRQGLDLGVEFEILVADDHSPEPVAGNEGINRLAYAKYEYLPENLGRSGSRNWLAQKAQYPYLLFIDGDMGVRDAGFLRKYKALLAEKTVICGGHFYESEPPEKERLLHWTYGRRREEKTAKERNKRPFQGFVPSNFVIPKALFEAIRFDESIRGYGHEDTLFGDILREMHGRDESVRVVHIDNGLVHLGLSTNAAFMDKVDGAVQNLIRLEKSHQFKATKLQETAAQLRFLAPVFRLLPLSFLRKRVMGTRNLRLLDLYKLGVYFVGV